MQYLTISNYLWGSKTVIRLITAGMPKSFNFKYKSGVEQKSLSCSQINFTLSFSDVAIFTSKKASEDQKKVLFQICMTLLYLRLQITSGDQKIKYKSYQLLLRRCKSWLNTQVFCCTFAPPVFRAANLTFFMIFSQLNFIFGPDVFFSPKAENLALFLASLKLS